MNSVECLLIGDKSIGKKCLIITYTTNTFPLEYVPTVLDSYIHTVLKNEEVFQLKLLIVPGQADYDHLRLLSYQETDVILMCFSVVNPNSFENVKTKWIPEIRRNNREKPFLLIGTKIDLRDDPITLENLAKNNEKPISMEAGEKLAKELKAVKYLECSALTQEGLENIFEEVISIVLERKEPSRKKCYCTLH